MAKKLGPPQGAIVQGALESHVDPKRPSRGQVILNCGHCGAYVREVITLCYHDPTESGVSYDEQFENYQGSLSSSLRCRKCKVLNVSMDVESYLREQRRLWKKLKKVWKSMFKDEDGDTKNGKGKKPEK